MSQLILQPFPCFTYVTTHYPTFLLLHLCHSSFSNPSFASPVSQDFHLRYLASRPWQWAFSKQSMQKDVGNCLRNIKLCLTRFLCLFLQKDILFYFNFVVMTNFQASDLCLLNYIYLQRLDKKYWQHCCHMTVCVTANLLCIG